MLPFSLYTTAVFLFVTLNAVAVLGQSCVASTSISLQLSRNYLSGCTVSTGTHSFSIDNPTGSAIRYYSTDGTNCASLYNGGNAGGIGVFYPAFSNNTFTQATLISVNNAPCNANPCCVVINCVSEPTSQS